MAAKRPKFLKNGIFVRKTLLQTFNLLSEITIWRLTIYCHTAHLRISIYCHTFLLIYCRPFLKISIITNLRKFNLLSHTGNFNLLSQFLKITIYCHTFLSISIYCRTFLKFSIYYHKSLKIQFTVAYF